MNREKQGMSAGKKVLLVILALTVAAAGVTVLVITLGKKTPVTSETFMEVLAAHGIPYRDITADLTLESREYRQGILGEGTDPAQYVRAEYYLMVSESAAMRFSGSMRASLEAKKGSVSTQTSTALGNYEVYTLDTNGIYYYVARVEETVVVLMGDHERKGEVKEMIKAFGY